MLKTEIEERINLLEKLVLENGINPFVRSSLELVPTREEVTPEEIESGDDLRAMGISEMSIKNI